MEWSKVFLSNLKLRGSYGNIGNQSIEPYAFIPGMEDVYKRQTLDNLIYFPDMMPTLAALAKGTKHLPKQIKDVYKRQSVLIYV